MDDVLRQRVERQRRAAGIPPDSTASNQANQETPLDRFRQRIQEASAENIQRQELVEESRRQRAMRYWNDAAQDNDNEGA